MGSKAKVAGNKMAIATAAPTPGIAPKFRNLQEPCPWVFSLEISQHKAAPCGGKIFIDGATGEVHFECCLEDQDNNEGR